MDTEPVATIILRRSEGVHLSAGETHTVHHNGDAYVIPYETPTDVPQCVLDVLTDSRLTWYKLDEVEPIEKPEGPLPKKKTDPQDKDTSATDKDKKDKY